MSSGERNEYAVLLKMLEVIELSQRGADRELVDIVRQQLLANILQELDLGSALRSFFQRKNTPDESGPRPALTAPRACHVIVLAATEIAREQAIQALQDLGLDPVELFSSAQTISYRVSSDRPAHVRNLLEQVTFEWAVITPDIPDYLFYYLYIHGLREQHGPATETPSQQAADSLPANPAGGELHQLGRARADHQLGAARSDGHAFVSYVREDGPVVDQIQQALEDAGVPVWRDSAALSPGDDRRDVIRRAITGNARVFLACFSRHSLANQRSDHNEQLALAIDQMHIRDRSKPWLIPVRLDDCTIPDHDIGWGRTLASIQCADLSGDHFEQGMKSLTASVLRILAQ